MSSKVYDDHISLDVLDSRLQDCANILRGSVDKGRYKDFVLPLVFYAAINGRFKREREQMVQKREQQSFEELSEEDQAFYSKQTKRELGIKLPNEHTWNDLMDEEDKLSVKIDKYLNKFENENSRRYKNIFNNKFNSIDSFTGEEGTQLLRGLLQKIDAIDFSSIPPDVMGEGYMNLVKKFSEAESGEYFTPPRIVDLMVRLLEPFEEGSKFHDPTAGSAGMLIEAAQHIREQYGDQFDSRDELQDILEREFVFTGQEKNPTITGIAKMNMALHGLDGRVKRGDSLTNPQFTRSDQTLEQFDYILANFPFSQRGWKKGTELRQDQFGDMDWADNGKLPNGNYGDYAFVMHMYSQLNEQGQLATVIPHGVLFRNGDQRYREFMIEEDIVEAVIGLPENLFEATGIPSGILVLNKDKPESRQGEVMFFNADHEDRFFYDTGSSRTKLLEDGIAEIKENYESWSDEERVCRVVDNDEIRENEYNMNIALYVDTTEPQEDIKVRDTLASVRDIEHEYQQLNQQFTQYMQKLNYEDNNQGDTE